MGNTCTTQSANKSIVARRSKQREDTRNTSTTTTSTIDDRLSEDSFSRNPLVTDHQYDNVDDDDNDDQQTSRRRSRSLQISSNSSTSGVVRRRVPTEAPLSAVSGRSTNSSGTNNGGGKAPSSHSGGGSSHRRIQAASIISADLVQALASPSASAYSTIARRGGARSPSVRTANASATNSALSTLALADCSGNDESFGGSAGEQIPPPALLLFGIVSTDSIQTDSASSVDPAAMQHSVSPPASTSVASGLKSIYALAKQPREGTGGSGAYDFSTSQDPMSLFGSSVEYSGGGSNETQYDPQHW